MGSLSADFNRHLTLHFPEILQGRSILALSGGIDSIVLCELLCEARIDFSLAHCNFQLRGGESDADQEFVQELAKKKGLEVHCKSFDTKGYARNFGKSLQIAARELRYAWFEELLEETSSEYLLTAHHADDNLETFLINLARGSGLKGLTGIPERNGRIRRPLLPFQREDIQDFALERKISWREDRSNAQSKYLRNRIRNELIPSMKETIPNLSTGFGKTLGHLKESQLIIHDRLAETWKQIASSEGDLIKLEIARIRSLNQPKAYLFGLLSEYGFTEWSDVAKLLSAQSGKMVFSTTHRLLKDRDHLLLQHLESLPDDEQNFTISRNQLSIELPSGTILLDEVSSSCEDRSLLKSPDSKSEILLDSDKLKFPLIVRKWQKGDYFYPKGMRGKKKLSKFFKDEKLSIPEKENIWLLCSGNEIAWVIGQRADERFKVTRETKSVLHVEWKRK